jgi:ATP-dependent exoDNAse (exonuclease V) alpha subunit
MDQSTALKILQSGTNVFLTGSAGTGKTYLLNQFIQTSREHGIPLAVTASTGIAATHLGGMTIHSWSGMGIKDEITQYDLEKIAKKKPLRERIEKTKILIIDEISMISKNFLQNLDQVLQYIKIDRRPFGGMQIVLCGDFFQLPPVSRVPLPNTEKFSFMAPVWVEAQLKVCYLTEQFRQDKDDLADFLNEMRTGDLSDARVDDLYECMNRTRDNEAEQVVTRLYTHNADVDRINREALAALKTPSKNFVYKSQGNARLVESLKKSILALDVLQLKISAPVMFVKNNPDKGFFNGTMGTVDSFDDEGLPVVMTHEGVLITAKPEEWRVSDIDGSAVAAYIQIPLRLAWAITVHKSQGMTLEQAEMDLSKTFELGQGYVALSRVKSWAGLRLLGCNRMALAIDRLVLKADQRFQELSAEFEAKFLALPAAQLIEQINHNITSLGGSLDPVVIEANRTKMTATSIKKPVKKVSTYLATKKLVEAKKNLLQIVKSRGMSEDTIVKHLQHLRGNYPELAMDYLRPEPKKLAEMLNGFITAKTKATPEQLGPDGQPRLKFVFEILNEKYFYRDLKLAQIFLER